MVMADKDRPKVAPTEVQPKASRRTFTAEYKRKILAQADACKDQHGELSKLLRREGLFSSHLVDWRAARERGELEALAPKKRGPKVSVPDAHEKRIAELERENERLLLRAERAEGLVELQKKVAELLGTPFEAPKGKR